MALIEYDFGQSTEPQPADSASAGNPGANIDQLLNILRRGLWLVIAGCCVGALLGFVYGATKANMFEANGKLLVQSGIRESATPESVLVPGGNQAFGAGQAVATELHILANPKIRDRVIAKIGADTILTLPDPRTKDGPGASLPLRLLHRFQAWWFGLDEQKPPMSENDKRLLAGLTLQASMSMAPSANSSVIDVFFIGPDPGTVKTIVDAFLEAAAEHHREVFRTGDEQLEFLVKREREAWEEYRRTNDALAEFRLNNDIYELGAQKGSLLSDIAALERRQAADRDESGRLRQKFEAVETAIREVEAQKSRSTNRIPNPEFARLQSELSNLRQRKWDLTQRAGEDHSAFAGRRKELEETMAEVQKTLAQTVETLPQEDTMQAQRLAQLLAQRDDLRVQLAALTGTGDKQGELLRQLKVRLRELQNAEPQNQSLEQRSRHCLQQAEQLTQSLERLRQIGLLDQQKLGNLRILQRSTLPREKVSPNRNKYLLLGIALGAACGLFLAFVRSAIDPVVRQPQELRNLAGRPVLGVVPRANSRAVAEVGSMIDGAHGDSPFQALVDALWAQVIPNGEPENRLQIACIGVDPGDGTTTVAGALGLGLALRTLKPVIIVETDFDNPRLADYFDVEPTPGLAEVLAGKATVQDAIQETGVTGLSVLCAGSGPKPKPGTYAAERRLTILRRAAEGRHYVVMDLAPLISDPESRVMLWDSDGTLLVTNSGSTDKKALRRVLSTIESSGSRLLGTILNRYRQQSWLRLPFSGRRGS